jgi:hypothetical protein
MASALVEVNSASLGGWTTTEDGIDVLGGETVSVRLVDSAGIRLWELDIISSDELVAAPAITQAPSVSGTATFTAPASPAGGWVLIVRSQVGVHALGHDLRNQPQDDYVATFGVHLPTAESLRLVAENETYEGSSEFGWMPKINELIRRAPATGTGVSTGRTLFGTSPVRIDGGASGDLSANRTISLVPGTVSGQVLGWNGSAWVARQVVVLTDLTLDGFATGVLHSTAGVISSSLIVNADVHASAAIAVSKLAAGTNGQTLITSGGVPTWGTPTAGSVTPGTARQIYFTNATPLAEWITASGDISVPTTAGVFRVDRINGTAVTTAGGGAVGSVLRMTGSATSDWGELDLADEDAVTGLLAVTHIAPGSNGQFLSTAGGVATWALVTTTSIAPGAANTVLTTNGAGNATAWATIVNANVDAAAGIEVTKLDPGAVNTILVTNASGDIEWVAGVPGAGTLAGDVTGPLGTNVVERVHGATVPIAGSLTTGNGLYVSGASALTYSALNLGGGSGWVTGALPLANIAQGGAATNDVLRWNGTVWDPEAIGNLLPPSATAVQIVDDMPALEALPVASLADVCMCIVKSPRRLYSRNASATGTSGSDSRPTANGGGAWDFVMSL